MIPVRFQDASRRVRRDGFHPSGGVSCGTVTSAPIPKRIIAARFLNAALSQRVTLAGGRCTVSTRLSDGACRNGLMSTPPRHPDGNPLHADLYLCYPYLVLRNTKRWGPYLPINGNCVARLTRFTPAVNGGILSLIKDSLRETRFYELPP
ncbi:hypothetical protein GCM10025751_24300 [Haladaptatus pallidirubidus]|uniref:Uncharacterized protein n=1 Tax=Haladaptatus pallidirubidus TaxID=1008152 RepID=A0AAV3UHD6_9EURY